MPGWSFAEPPLGFGWAPERHFRAVLRRDGENARVIVRRTWTVAGFQAERHVYESVLAQFSFVTPELLAFFKLDGCDTPWMVLQDIGEQLASSERSEDRRMFIGVLGHLHGTSQRLLASNQIGMGPLLSFPASLAYMHYDEWDAMLTRGMKSKDYGIPASALEACRKLRDALTAEPTVLLHGDTDFSNAIVTGEGIGLIDWERACLGPASLDLSRVVSASDLADDMQVYCESFNEGGGYSLTEDEAIRIGGLGLVFDSLRWICHFIKQATAGNSPGDEWRKQYYDPCLEALSSRTWLQYWEARTTEPVAAGDG